jgi:hypothetical protein
MENLASNSVVISKDQVTKPVTEFPLNEAYPFPSTCRSQDSILVQGQITLSVEHETPDTI